MTPDEAADLLRLKRGTSDKEAIKAAYRKLAMANHPDRNSGDKKAEARFKEIGEANAVMNEQASAPRRSAPTGAPVVSSPIRGADASVRVKLTLAQAFAGGFARVDASSSQCLACHGMGDIELRPTKTCDVCDGTGAVIQRSGFVSITAQCRACKGQGQFLSEACAGCDGHGRVAGKSIVRVEIPAGVDDGEVLVVEAAGAIGTAGGPPGDLHATVKIEPHPRLTRQGANLTYEVRVPYVDMCLGGYVPVPTADGKGVRMELPPLSKPGVTLKIPGYGMPDGLGGRGDMLVVPDVEIPDKLTPQQVTLLGRLRSVSK